jgi:hypothetical protein
MSVGANNPLVDAIIALVIVVVIFLVFRELVCWY